MNTTTHHEIAKALRYIRATSEEFVWVRLLHVNIDVQIDSQNIADEGGIYNFFEQWIYNNIPADYHEYFMEEINNHDVMCVDWEGTLTTLVTNEYGFDHEQYLELIEVAENVDSDVVEACNAVFGEVKAEYLELYIGEFKDDTDWAYEHVESTGLLSEVPENVKRYFDYEAFGRDADLSGDISSHNQHYFWNH